MIILQINCSKTILIPTIIIQYYSTNKNFSSTRQNKLEKFDISGLVSNSILASISFYLKKTRFLPDFYVRNHSRLMPFSEDIFFFGNMLVDMHEMQNEVREKVSKQVESESSVSKRRQREYEIRPRESEFTCQ